MLRFFILLGFVLMLSACVDNSGATTENQKVASILRVADRTGQGGDVQTALGMYQRAHSLQPENPLPLMKMGETLLKAGHPEQAREAFQLALEHGPEITPILRGLANAYIALGENDKALPLLKKAISITPEPQTFNSLGVAYDMMGQHGIARTHYFRGLQLIDMDLGLETNLALSYALSKRFKVAIQEMKKVTEMPVAGPRERQNLALIYGLAGQDEQVRETLAQDMNVQKISEKLKFYKYLRKLPDSMAILTEIYKYGGQH